MKKSSRLFAAIACILFFAHDASAQPQISRVATFLIFSIEDAPLKPNVALLESRRVEGPFKIPAGDVSHSHAHGPNMLVVEAVDRSGKTVYETHLFNPLDQSLEYVNEDGLLDRARVLQDEGTFEVRIPFDLDGLAVSVFVVDDNNRRTLLLTL